MPDKKMHMGASSSTNTQPTDAAALIAAVEAGDWPTAEALVADAGDRLPANALWPAAQVHLQAGRYERAQRLMGRMIDRDLVVDLWRRYAANMAAMVVHHPAIARQIEAAADGPYQITQTPGGELTIDMAAPDGRSVCLSPDRDPRGAVRQAAVEIEQRAGVSSPVALCGIGDGYVLDHLNHHGPQLEFTAELVVYIFEPDPALLRAVFMLHDYTGDGGPIAHPRFIWCTGPDWLRTYRMLLDKDVFIALPCGFVRQGAQGRAIETALHQVEQDIEQKHRATAAAIAAHYAQVDDAHWATIFSDNPPRQPRVLLITTRYSTVLQYSTQDAAAGFRANGFDAHVLIEPNRHRNIVHRTILDAIDRYKPDLVFQIDHLRHEHRGAIPRDLPFVCWVQDRLPRLFDAGAGRAIGPTDFVLTDLGAQLHRDHAYPPRQMIYLNKATRPVPPPARPPAQDIDLLFVSHGGAPIEHTIDQQLANHPTALPMAHALAARFNELIERDDFDMNALDVRAELDRAASLPGADAEFVERNRRMLIDWLYHPVFDRLYRHQVVRWACELAEEDGLTLALYGNGWESHPRFKPYARGVAQYGAQLIDITRRSRIGLQVVPYACLHQRLLDGLAAGGFFLVRHAPIDTNLPRLKALIDQHCDVRPSNAEEALANIDPAHRPALQSLFDEGFGYGYPPDELIWNIAHLDDPAHQLPHLEQVTFNNRASFRQRVRRYLADVPARRAIAARQAAWVEAHFDYTNQMKRIVAVIGRRLSGATT